jgi:amino acid transporter
MVFYLPALILLVIAYFIKFKKVTWLVSGYNTSSKKSKEKYDLEKLCRLMGNFVFGLSFILFIMATAMTLIPDQEEMLLLVGLAVLALYSLIGLLYLNTGRRVLKEE